MTTPTPSSNREALDRAVAAFNQRDLEGYLTLYDDSVTVYGYGEGPLDKAGAREFYAGILAALSDVDLQLFEAVEDAASIAVRFVLTGTHTGELAGVPATGRPISQNGITILRFRDGRVIERWSVADFLSVMMQIGAIPAPA